MEQDLAVPTTNDRNDSANYGFDIKPLSAAALGWQQADEPLLKWALVTARMVTEADNATFAAIERETEHAVIVASAAESPQELWRTRFSLNDGVAGRVVATKRPLLVNQASDSKLFRKLGTRVIQSILAVPVEAEGHTLGVLTVTSARVNAFRVDAAEVLQAIAGQLSAGLTLARQSAGLAQLRDLAHDLNTPLSALRGFIHLALDSDAPLPALQREYLELAAVATDQLVHLAGDMHDVMYLSSGMLPMSLRQFIPAEIARSVVAASGPLASEAGARIDFFAADDLPPIYADRRRVERILGNLLQNAIKFAPTGSAIRVAVGPDGPDGVCFTVDDEGPGILEEEAVRLFEPTFRGAVPPERAAEGHGLGLSIASALATAHGGRISAQNRATGGARFRLYLPISPPVARPRDAQYERADSPDAGANAP